MSQINDAFGRPLFEAMRGTPPPSWEQTCLDLDKKLADSRQHVTELENRLRALWDKYDGDRKHYMDRIKRMEEVGDEMLNWLTDDGISVENLRLIANAWRKAKEAKL